jgi:membrane-bound hydrogenase subunit beta
MSEETAIQDQLTSKFPNLKDKVRVARQRRVFVDVSSGELSDVIDHAVRRMDFSILCTITGLDLGENLGVMYHLARPSGVVLTIAAAVPKSAPSIKSITGYFPAADAYEREMVDLLGMDVQGLLPGNRYPLPDDWPKGVYPLRKDYNVEETLKKEGSP